MSQSSRERLRHIQCKQGNVGFKSAHCMADTRKGSCAPLCPPRRKGQPFDKMRCTEVRGEKAQLCGGEHGRTDGTLAKTTPLPTSSLAQLMGTQQAAYAVQVTHVSVLPRVNTPVPGPGTSHTHRRAHRRQDGASNSTYTTPCKRLPRSCPRYLVPCPSLP